MPDGPAAAPRRALLRQVRNSMESTWTPQQVELQPPLGSEVPWVEKVASLDPSELSEWTSFQGPLVRLLTLVEQLTIRPFG